MTGYFSVDNFIFYNFFYLKHSSRFPIFRLAEDNKFYTPRLPPLRFLIITKNNRVLFQYGAKAYAKY